MREKEENLVALRFLFLFTFGFDMHHCQQLSRKYCDLCFS